MQTLGPIEAGRTYPSPSLRALSVDPSAARQQPSLTTGAVSGDTRVWSTAFRRTKQSVMPSPNALGVAAVMDSHHLLYSLILFCTLFHPNTLVLSETFSFTLHCPVSQFLSVARLPLSPRLDFGILTCQMLAVSLQTAW